VTGLMQSEVAHASPLLELARLHLDPLLLGMDDLPRPMTDAASAQLGKLNPVTLRGLDRFFHRPSHRTGGYGVGAFAGLGGGWGAFNDVVTVGAAGLGVGITSLLTTFVYGRRVAGYAQNDELRGAALVAANPGLSFQEAERSEAGPLRAAYALPKGDRSTWIRDQLQLRGGTAAHIDFESNRGPDPEPLRARRRAAHRPSWPVATSSCAPSTWCSSGSARGARSGRWC
jgi:hypothetical protein